MARKIQKYLIILVVVLVLAAPIAVFGQSAIEQTVQLVLRSGKTLETGRYEVTVKLPDGGVEDGQIQVAADPAAAAPSEGSEEKEADPAGEPAPAATSPAAAQEGQTPPASQASGGVSLPLILGAVAAVLVLAAVGAFVYFKIILPPKQLQPYKKALQLLRDKEYAMALPALTKIEGKLPDGMRSECRFFIAFVKQQLNKLDQAINDLDTLHEEDLHNADVAYLLAYIYLQKDDLRKAETVLEGMEKEKQLGHRDAKKLLGIVKFRRAYLEMKEGRVDAAEDLFEKVKALGDFAGQIPSDLRDRNMLLGTRALFDHNSPEARTLFNRLINDLGTNGASENRGLLASAKAGLALADWIDEKEGRGIEALLVESARLIDPGGKLRMSWSTETAQQEEDLAGQLEELEMIEQHSPLPAAAGEIDKEYRLMLRDIHFLRAMNQLREWKRMEGDEAYKNLQENYQAVLEMLACARALDDRFSDVYLVAGLLMFYLHKQGLPERSQGIDLLQEAQKLGMREPTALEILNNREKSRQANKGAIEEYLQVLDKYINDVTVRKEIRMRLLEQRRRFQRIQAADKRPDPGNLRAVEPTVAEMQHRTEILLARVNQIISEQHSAETVDLTQLCAQIQQGSEALVKQAQAIETTEAVLLEKTGSQLFRD